MKNVSKLFLEKARVPLFLILSLFYFSCSEEISQFSDAGKFDVDALQQKARVYSNQLSEELKSLEDGSSKLQYISNYSKTDLFEEIHYANPFARENEGDSIVSVNYDSLLTNEHASTWYESFSQLNFNPQNHEELSLFLQEEITRLNQDETIPDQDLAELLTYLIAFQTSIEFMSENQELMDTLIAEFKANYSSTRGGTDPPNFWTYVGGAGLYGAAQGAGFGFAIGVFFPPSEAVTVPLGTFFGFFAGVVGGSTIWYAVYANADCENEDPSIDCGEEDGENQN